MVSELPSWPLFGFADDARPALRRLLEAGRPAALATIAGLSGGGPRPVGTQMVIGEGEVSGFLSGGCLESDLAGHASQVLLDGAARRLIYGEGSPWPDIRLMCGARIEILLERILPGDEAATALFHFADERCPALWLSDGKRRECAPAEAAPQPWPDAVSLLFEPPYRLVVVGADPTALAIASLGAAAGYETLLVRPKGPAEGPPLAGVAYTRADPAAALAGIGLDPWTAVAIATHEAELDHAALVVALPSPAFYVGALGARRRLPERLAWLAAEGLSSKVVDRLHAPIGLSIGGKAPWEVATAVVAEITRERYRPARVAKKSSLASSKRGRATGPSAPNSMTTPSAGRQRGHARPPALPGSPERTKAAQ